MYDVCVNHPYCLSSVICPPHAKPHKERPPNQPSDPSNPPNSTKLRVGMLDVGVGTPIVPRLRTRSTRKLHAMPSMEGIFLGRPGTNINQPTERFCLCGRSLLKPGANICRISTHSTTLVLTSMLLGASNPPSRAKQLIRVRHVGVDVPGILRRSAAGLEGFHGTT